MKKLIVALSIVALSALTASAASDTVNYTLKVEKYVAIDGTDAQPGSADFASGGAFSMTAGFEVTANCEYSLGATDVTLTGPGAAIATTKNLIDSSLVAGISTGSLTVSGTVGATQLTGDYTGSSTITVAVK